MPPLNTGVVPAVVAGVAVQRSSRDQLTMTLNKELRVLAGGQMSATFTVGLDSDASTTKTPARANVGC
jgi:hypothetical protein